MPVLGPQTGIGPWPAGNQATQQGVSGRQAGRAPAVCAAAPQGQRLRLGSSGIGFTQEPRAPVPRRSGTAAADGSTLRFCPTGGRCLVPLFLHPSHFVRTDVEI